MENLIDKLYLIIQYGIDLFAVLCLVLIGLLIHDYLRRKSGARKFKR